MRPPIEVSPYTVSHAQGAIMVRFLRLLFIVLLASSFETMASSAAPVCQDDPFAAFAKIGVKIRKDFKAMGAARAGDVQDQRVLPIREFSQDIFRYLRQQNSREQKNAATAILYAIDGDDMCIFAWMEGDRGGRRLDSLIRTLGDASFFVSEPKRPYYYERVKGGARKLLQLSNQLTSFLVKESRRSARAPKRKATIRDWFAKFFPKGSADESIEVTSPASSNLEFDELLISASALLFPARAQEILRQTDMLTIIPSGPISLFPFYALYPFGNTTPAVERLTINIVAFPSELSEFENGELAPIVLKKRGGVQIFGNPFPISDPDWDFPSLPGALQEAKVVQKQLGGELLSGEAATARQFLKRIRTANLVHVATHGMASDSSPIDGGFLAMHQGRVTAREVQDSKLLGRPLIVLSACQTGIGQAIDAGVIGLARAFQIAGAANTVMSLWSIDDQPTKTLMSEFAAELVGKSPAAALRKAILKARKVHRDPLLWAPFNIFGAGGLVVRREG